ncbi:MAG TPA: hypothetical protein VFB32_10000 [Rudaea sp.]|nr:hypothetical protein [Rudaea sp.]
MTKEQRQRIDPGTGGERRAPKPDAPHQGAQSTRPGETDTDRANLGERDDAANPQDGGH